MSKSKIRKIVRKCLVCGKSIRIKVYEDGHYSNGHYYNKIKLPIKGAGEYKKVGTTKLGRHKVDVVDWTGKEKEIEYWECNECFDEASHKSWLEETLEKLYGKRCSDYEKDCACCRVWEIYDTIIETDSAK